jgi:hypothetical protein
MQILLRVAKFGQGAKKPFGLSPSKPQLTLRSFGKESL